MSLTSSFSFRELAALGLACLALSAPPRVHAAVVVSTYSYSVDDPAPPAQFRFNTGPFGFAPTDVIPVSGVVSTAHAVDNRRSRLPTGPNGQTVFEDVTDDSGYKSSMNAGQTVVAGASLSPLPFPLQGPAVARSMSELRNLHASAGTAHQLFFRNINPVTIGGVTHDPDAFYLQHRRSATAGSAWFETWTADKAGAAHIKLALDGHLGFNSFCSSGNNCGVVLPQGTDAVVSDDPSLSLRAMFRLVDLSELLICDDPDECGTVGVAHPLPLNILTARFDGDNGLPFDFMDEWTLSFNASAGHRYLLVGALEVVARNGGVIDFFNTMRISGIDVARGVLFSDATGRDVADLFAQDPGAVPSPGTLWLVLAGGAAALFFRRRGLSH